MTDLNELEKFLDKAYRDSYLESHVKSVIAYQIQIVRHNLGLSQSAFGKLIGQPQTVVSRMENANYGGLTVRSLLKIAYALGIGLEVRFRDYAYVLDGDVSQAALAVENIKVVLNRHRTDAAAAESWTSGALTLIFRNQSVGDIPWPNNQQIAQPQQRIYRGSGTPSSGISTPM